MSPSPPPTEPAPADDATVGEQPPLPPGTPPPVDEGETAAEGEGETAETEQQEQEGEQEGEAAAGEEAEGTEKEGEEPAAPAGVHKGKEGWTAVWDPSSVLELVLIVLYNSRPFDQLQIQRLLLLQLDHQRNDLEQPSRSRFGRQCGGFHLCGSCATPRERTRSRWH